VGTGREDAHASCGFLPCVDGERSAGAHTGGALEERIRGTGIDTLVFDIQDVGTRFYTYVWLLYECMLAAAALGVTVVVLDRPNPVGGLTVEGPVLQPGFESDVGRQPIAQRHAMTVGELAGLFNLEFVAPQLGSLCELEVRSRQRETRGGRETLTAVAKAHISRTSIVYTGCLFDEVRRRRL
jgi:hypothetical protein